MAERLNATLSEQTCFEALAGYLHECSGLGRKAITESETPSFRFVAVKIKLFGAAVAYLSEITTWESLQKTLNSVKESWNKARALQDKLFRYRGYITKPGEASAKFGSIEEMTYCAIAYMKQRSWADAILCINALKTNFMEDLYIELVPARLSSAAQDGAQASDMAH